MQTYSTKRFTLAPAVNLRRRRPQTVKDHVAQHGSGILRERDVIMPICALDQTLSEHTRPGVRLSREARAL